MCKKLFAILLSACIAASLMLGASASASVRCGEDESITLFILDDDRASD